MFTHPQHQSRPAPASARGPRSPSRRAAGGPRYFNTLIGNGGNDTLDGRSGTDTLDGGPGTDTGRNGETYISIEVQL